MHQAQFELPVRVVLREKVHEISNPQSALEFLLKCPVQEGPIFESAVEACFSATMNRAPADEARMGLATYAKIYGVLVEDARSAATPRPKSPPRHHRIYPTSPLGERRLPPFSAN